MRSAVENPKPFLEDNDEFAAALAKSGAENKIIAIPGGQASVVDNAPEKTLVEQFGCPAFFNFKGALSKLNEPFWAAYYARQELELLFEPNEQEFYSYDETTGLFVVRSPDLIRKKLAAQILEAGRLRTSGFPTWLVWVALHVLALPQLQNRFRVQTQWLWSYLTGQRSSRLIREAP